MRDFYISEVPLRFVSPSIIFTSIFIFILYFASTAFYNLFFHPLKKFPGPKLAAISRIPVTCSLIRGIGPRWQKKLHEKYGPVIRVAPGELSFINPQAWKDIYGSTTYAKYGMKRSDDFFAYWFDQQSTAASIVSTDENVHRRLRKIFLQAFSKPALAAQEPLIVGHIDRLVEKLRETASSDGTINMVDMHSFTVFDIMADLMFGESLHLLEYPEETSWVKSVPGYIRASIILGSLAQFTTIRLLLTIIAPRIVASSFNKFLASVSKKVNSRLASDPGRPDIIHFLSEGLDEKMRLSRPEIDNASLVLMIAGSDTTPSTLCGITYLLLAKRNKHILEKLVHEIRSSFDSDESINLQSTSKLEYLGACIEEGFRAYSPAPIGFPRDIPPGGASVCGHWVPDNTAVYITPLAAYESPLNFRDPEKFLPERWLPQSDSFSSFDQRSIVQPFSFGPRDCLGRDMAYGIIRLVFCKLLWQFDLLLQEENENWIGEQRIFGTWEKLPIWVKAKPVVR